MRRNDKARMSNDEGMTKAKDQNMRENYDPFGDDGEVSIVREEPDGKRVYDLEERTARFGEAVIDTSRCLHGLSPYPGLARARELTPISYLPSSVSGSA